MAQYSTEGHLLKVYRDRSDRTFWEICLLRKGQEELYRNKDNKSYKENSCSDERSVENAISFNIKN